MRLSICIPTLNRGAFIGATLDSILEQLQDDMEVVVVDGGSRDGTAEVVAARTARCARVRYHLSEHLATGVPKPSNAGFDRDCDRAVELAQGRYCWILPDDDLVAPGGMQRLLAHLERGVALVVVNAQVWSNDLSTVFDAKRLAVDQDQVFTAGQADRLLTLVGGYLSYVGGVVVRREWWLARDRVVYYGSGFIHMAALFQRPADLDAAVIAEPLIRLRYGNALWSRRAFEIWMYQWPDLIWSFPLPDHAKAAVTAREPWRSAYMLMVFRARGNFGLAEYRQMAARSRPSAWVRLYTGAILAMPGWALNLAALAIAIVRTGRRSTSFLDFWNSPNNLLKRMARA